MKIPFWEILVCSCLISITCSENVSEDLNENFEGYEDVLNDGYEIIKFEDHHLTVSNNETNLFSANFKCELYRLSLIHRSGNLF